MINPLVSIALCTYNGDKFLEEQLDSLVNQTYQNIEIIIIDDFSSDQTIEILKVYSDKFPFIKLYQNEVNLGYIKNFEKAISLCIGDFIALADQDDIWKLDKIEFMLQHIGTNILLYHDSAFIDENGKSMDKKLSDIVNFYDGNSPDAFLFFNCVSSHALLFNKVLKNHLFPFPQSNLHDAWIAYVALNIGSISYLKNCLVSYRNHTTNSTDILKRRTTEKKTKIRNEMDWLTCCQNFTHQKNPEFLIKALNLFKSRGNNSLPIFLLFMNNYKNIFAIYKKSFFSKLNFIIKKSLSTKNEKAN